MDGANDREEEQSALEVLLYLSDPLANRPVEAGKQRGRALLFRLLWLAIHLR